LAQTGISGTLDAAANTFTAAYGDGETIQIDFGTGAAYLNGPYTMRNFDSFTTPESRGLANGMRYGVQPMRGNKTMAKKKSNKIPSPYSSSSVPYCCLPCI
jgi:hypothetical protein